MLVNAQNRNSNTFPSYIVPFHSPSNAPQAGPRIAKDQVSISSEAKTQNNPFQAMGAQTAQVKVDAWGKGKNDCLEHILKNQGYSLKEIYGKDENGKSMLDQIVAVNNLKNANLVPAGASLKVPSKLKADNSPKTEIKRETGKNYSVTDINDKDQKHNLHVFADRRGVTVANWGGKDGETAWSSVDISEKSRDGYFENKARDFAEYFGLQKKETPKGRGFGDASQVSVLQNDNGAHVFATVDGQERHVLSTAGDRDDGIVERAGELVDDGVKAAKGYWNWLTK
jgi:hypothetical protein